MKKAILALLVGAAVFTSCKKDDKVNTSGPTPQGPYVSMSEVFAGKTVQAKTITLDAAMGGSFRGNSGSRYTIPANAFVTMAGAAVTGNVQISVKEYLKRSDMIYSRMLPESNGAPLNSGGEISIAASQNGQALRFKQGKYYSVSVPQGGTPVPGMQLFYGAASTANPQYNTVNWVLVQQDSFHIGTVVYNGDSISVFSDSMGVCNIDQYIPNPSYQTFTVNIAGVTITNSADVRTYALYDAFNAVTQLGTVNGNVISVNHVANQPVHFIVMAIVNGDFYAGIAAATPSNGATYTVTLSQTTPAALAAQIDAL